VFLFTPIPDAGRIRERTMLSLFATLISLQAAPAAAQTTYDAALRCSGLSQAASELEGGETSRGKRLYDAALYWSLQTNLLARQAGRAQAQADAEQARARVQAVREFSGQQATAARAELERCLAQTPALG
jgi:endonuclease/exonuclease/phosphatase (EEP) superfamily protein YafD